MELHRELRRADASGTVSMDVSRTDSRTDSRTVRSWRKVNDIVGSKVARSGIVGRESLGGVEVYLVLDRLVVRPLTKHRDLPERGVQRVLTVPGVLTWRPMDTRRPMDPHRSDHTMSKRNNKGTHR